jgi:hypothetical protein
MTGDKAERVLQPDRFMSHPTVSPVATADVPLERDLFLRILIRELSGTLQDVVGLEEASGFVSVVGQRVGEQINADYRAALGTETLDRAQVRDVLIDLKRRIKGDFFVIEEDEDRRSTCSDPARLASTTTS